MFQRKNKSAATFLSSGDRIRIAEAIGRAEAKTSGEIRVKVIGRCDDDVRGDVRAQAVREFHREGLGNTREKTGVLILIVAEERSFFILGDEGINERVDEQYWEQCAVSVRAHFRQGDFFGGISRIVTFIGETLSQYFPRAADDTNELPNDVIIGTGI